MDNKHKKNNIRRKVRNIRATGEKAIKSDVQGSYTGVPDEPDERPVQDADDL